LLEARIIWQIYLMLKRGVLDVGNLRINRVRDGKCLRGEKEEKERGNMIVLIERGCRLCLIFFAKFDIREVLERLNTNFPSIAAHLNFYQKKRN